MAELKARQPAPAGLAAVPPDRMAEVIRRGGSAKRGDGPARFEVGQRVVARNIHPTGHTRIPRYVRSRTGTDDRDHRVFVFPATNAHDRGEAPPPCYSAPFTAREHWGPAPPDADSD